MTVVILMTVASGNVEGDNCGGGCSGYHDDDDDDDLGEK